MSPLKESLEIRNCCSNDLAAMFGEDVWEYLWGDKWQKAIITIQHQLRWGFPGGPNSKESACNAGDLGSVPSLGRSPGEGNSNPLSKGSLLFAKQQTQPKYSCLGENSMGRGA